MYYYAFKYIIRQISFTEIIDKDVTFETLEEKEEEEESSEKETEDEEENDSEEVITELNILLGKSIKTAIKF